MTLLAVLMLQCALVKAVGKVVAFVVDPNLSVAPEPISKVPDELPVIW